MRHRATTRYKNGGKHRGKTISHREKARRIAHSQGWRMTLMDMPLSWFAFMKKGGIEFKNLIDLPNQPSQTEFVDAPATDNLSAETKTLQL